MRRLFTALALAAAVSAAAAQEVRVEFRAAAAEAAEGWSEMTAPDGAAYWVAPEAVITNADIERAEAALDPASSMPVVHVSFTADGAKAFGAFTRDNVLGLIAIIIDGVVVSAPRINEPILGGRAVISGNFTMEEAERIARGIVAKE
ncbi:MAG: hypothetical protein QM698_01080 [Micropepsaceae bacterium]